MGILNFLRVNPSGRTADGGLAQAGSATNCATTASESNAAVREHRIAAMDTTSYLASDENDWVIYLRQALRTYRKPGITLQEEHHLWLASRARSRVLAQTKTAKAS